jgi:hypothetical protein
MTLRDLLQPFAQHDLPALSQRTRKLAAGCGAGLEEALDLTSEEWNLVDDIAQAVFRSPRSNAEKIRLGFEVFEMFPSQWVLCVLFNWFYDDADLTPPERAEVWRKMAGYLDGEPCHADPVAYKLWIDMFEDVTTVEEAWRGVTNACASDRALNRLLDVSGPVPYALKLELYEKLLPRPETHPGILRSLYFSAHDAFGIIDAPQARSLLTALQVDRASKEFCFLAGNL